MLRRCAQPVGGSGDRGTDRIRRRRAARARRHPPRRPRRRPLRRRPTAAACARPASRPRRSLVRRDRARRIGRGREMHDRRRGRPAGTAASGRRRCRRSAARSAAPSRRVPSPVPPVVPTTSPAAHRVAAADRDRREERVRGAQVARVRDHDVQRLPRRRPANDTTPGPGGAHRSAGRGREVDAEMSGAETRRRRIERPHDGAGDRADPRRSASSAGAADGATATRRVR